MFDKSPIETELDEKILAAFRELDQHTSDTEEYANILHRITTLHKLKSEEASNSLRILETEHRIEDTERQIEIASRLRPPSADTMLTVGANLLGIWWLTRFEAQENVIRSKALGFIIKPR